MECLWTGGGWKNLHQPPTYLKKDQPPCHQQQQEEEKCPAISFKQATKNNMKEKNWDTILGFFCLGKWILEKVYFKIYR
jgi:hypothetical protein